MQIDQRILKLLQLLNEQNGVMTSEQIAFQLTTSTRTIRELLSNHRKVLASFDIEIVTKGRSGLQLLASRQALASFLEECTEIPQEDERIVYILNAFLGTSEYIKLDDLSDQMWISRSTMNRIFKDVRTKLKEYQLDIVSKPSYGLRVEGDEMQKRLCLVQCCIPHKEQQFQQFLSQLEGNGVIEEQLIHTLCAQILEEEQFHLTDLGFRNLVIHLLISLYRIKNDSEIKEGLQLDKERREWKIALKITQQMNEQFNIEMNEYETEYVQVHLLGKQALEQKDMPVITKEIEDLVSAGNQRIKECLQYDFSSDFELFTLLSIHMIPLLTRLRYGLDMPNPMLPDIKLHLSKGYECAIITAKVIEENTSHHMIDGELGYLAMHYALAIERIQEQRYQKNILLVCGSGMGTSKLLKHRIQKKFHIEENNIHVVDMVTLKSMDLSFIDQIISTVKLPFEIKKPIIYMQNLFEEVNSKEETADASLLNLLSSDHVFLSQSFTNKEEILDFLCTKAEKEYQLDHGLREKIKSREDIFATEVGNGVAMPHPISLCTEQSILYLMTLKKPILWGTQPIRIVFMISSTCKSREESEHLNDELISVIMNAAILQSICKASSYEELKNVL